MDEPLGIQKNNPFKDKIFIICLGFAVFFFIIKIVLIFQAMLLDDEANYVVWARHLPFGFYDHGAGIAFFIKPFLLLFGENSLGARIGGQLGMAALSLYLYKFCAKYSSPRSGAAAFLLFHMIPVFQGLAVLNTPDTPMMISLLAALMLFYEALHSHKHYFYAAGFFIGFALLSKVSTAFVIAPLGIILLAGLKKGGYKKELFAALALALVAYLPFIIYWFQTDFAPLKFMLLRTSSGTNFNAVKDFWLAQLVFFSPLFFILFLWSLIELPRQILKKDKRAYFACLSAVPFAVFLYSSLVKRMEANWAMSMYAGAFFPAVFFIGENWHKFWVRAAFLVNMLFCAVISGIFAAQYCYKFIPLSNDPTDRFYHYTAFPGEFKKYYQSSMDKNIPIAGFDYGTPSMVNVYVQPEKEALSFNWGRDIKTSYEFWRSEADLIGQDFYFLKGDRDAANLAPHFEEVQYLTNFSSLREGRSVRDFYLFYCKKYKGE